MKNNPLSTTYKIPEIPNFKIKNHVGTYHGKTCEYVCYITWKKWPDHHTLMEDAVYDAIDAIVGFYQLEIIHQEGNDRGQYMIFVLYLGVLKDIFPLRCEDIKHNFDALIKENLKRNGIYDQS